MMMSGPALVSIAEAIRGLRSFMLIRSAVTSTPASFANSPTSFLNSTSAAGTKLTQVRMLSFVPFGKLGAFCAATIPGMPPATAAPVATPAAFRKARLSMLVPPSDSVMGHPRAGNRRIDRRNARDHIIGARPCQVPPPVRTGYNRVERTLPQGEQHGCLDDNARAGRGASL